ncbi:MAG: hypothetical protein ABI581_14285 [Sediminibacterium sp.]
MKNILILFTYLFFIVSGNAQSKQLVPGYYIFPQVGLMNGDHSVNGQIHLTGGIQKKAWMFGLGTAIDYYKIRTVPVFADVRYVFGNKRNFFSYADLGANFAWALESQYENHYLIGVNSYTPNTFSNGLYTDVGLGYAFRGGKKGGCVISIGYSSKTVTSSYQEIVYTPFPPYTFEYYDRKKEYTFNRLVLRLGVRL